MQKSIGYIGLGKMGLNMVLRLREKEWRVVAYNRSPEPRELAAKEGIEVTDSVEKLAAGLHAPKLIWLMVSHGAVDAMLQELAPHLAKGDVVVDGGNSFYKDTMRRAKELAEKDIYYLDAGVSGGPRGAREGACVMVGGEKAIFEKYEQLFKDIASPDAYGYFGKSGAGHFTKMIHNGIEYGMMQAIAEGFAVLKASEFKLDLKNVADLYNHRSVIESRLVGWLKDAFEKYSTELAEVSGSAQQSGEGLWTVETAKEFGIPVPIIEGALKARLDSQKNPSYIGKVVQALRNQFGGHATR